jgi:uncharacterized membrane protein (DUF4010 family)
MLLPRVWAITLVLSRPVAGQLTPYLVPGNVIGGAVVSYVLIRGRPTSKQSEVPDRSPLRLLTAIQMAVAFQLVLLAIPVVQRSWGARGVLASAAVLGLTDMDALTFSMARLGAQDNAGLAAKAIAIGILSNTILKLALVLALGTGRFRKAAVPGLLTLGAAVVAGLLIWP